VAASRRRFIKGGLVLLSGLFGGQALSRLAASFGGRAAAAQPATGAVAPSDDQARRRWAFAIDTTSCVGCGLCVEACKAENQLPADPSFNRTWVERHVIAMDGSVFVDSPDGGIHGFPPESTAPGAAGQAVRQSFFMPRLCMQCANSPCVSICPVSANSVTPDGVVLIDADRCIGCGYCVVACPYGARYIVPGGDGEASGRTPGVADKCTWCYHRIAAGRLPACVEVCPMGSRIFGDLNDPQSRLNGELKRRRSDVLRPELGTRPRVYYLGLEVETG
jgi:Fe-S-cluster-containing dehydrogenase component